MPVLTENPQQQVVRKGILMIMVNIRVIMMAIIMVLFLEVVVISFFIFIKKTMFATI